MFEILNNKINYKKKSRQSVGILGTPDWRLFITSKNKVISPWHDILFTNGTSLPGDRLINMVNEIPKGTRAKLEMSKSLAGNPILQDKDKLGELRFIKYAPVLYNYGFIPQTWEDPSIVDSRTNIQGDDDPLDIIDIGYRRREIGEVYRVKVVGSLALIDEGETDWKILAISLDDPCAKSIKTVEDIQKEKPGIINSISDWYKNYKIVDGKPQNNFAFNGKVQDATETWKVIDDCHLSWKKISKTPELSQKYFVAYSQIETEKIF